jgi:hypothetical protein
LKLNNFLKFAKNIFCPPSSRGIKGLLILISFFCLSATPVYAFNLLDFIFPPVKMESSTRSAPGPALAPEIPSNNTHSNTLKDNTATHNGYSTISKSWQPVMVGTGVTDSNGNEIQKYVDYDANGPITGKFSIKSLSNNYYRDFQSFFARGSIKCTEAGAKANFSSFDIDGSSASLRATPAKQIYYYRSQFLSEDIQSLDQKNLLDTVVQDYQIAWSCNGLCQELTNKSNTSSCRPVYLSELLFGLQDQALYYSTPDSTPTLFPSELISAVNTYYSSSCSSLANCYSLRSKGKSFTPLSKDLYSLMYQQINYVPKGNAIRKIVTINYNCTDANGEPSCPVATTVENNLPNAAAATSKYSESLSYVNPANQSDLGNASLDNIETSSDTALDQPLDVGVSLFAAFEKHVSAGASLTKNVHIGITTIYDAQVVTTAQIAEKAFLNMIPAAAIESKSLQNISFASSTTSDKNNSVPDPGYRADMLYQEMRTYLRPSTWF